MPRSKVQINEIKYKYSKHEVVWAKITGYPWWPASITCTPSKTNCFYKVDFMGDRSYAFLSESKIANYLDYRHQYQINKKNNKHFQNAVTLAARKYQELLLRQGAMARSKGPVERKTSQQKQQLKEQIELPQNQEKVQQISSQKQKLNGQKCPRQIKTGNITGIEVIQEQKHACLEQQGILQNGSNDMQCQSSCSERDKKEKQIEQILVKYKLNSIPIFKQQKRNQKESLAQRRTSLHSKKKFIFKNKRSSQAGVTGFGEDQLLARKLYGFLLVKLHSTQQCRHISLSLKDQITKQKAQKVQCFRKVVEWIRTSDPQNISNYHSQWVNFYKDSQRQRQKHSTLTMEDESEELAMK